MVENEIRGKIPFGKNCITVALTSLISVLSLSAQGWKELPSLPKGENIIRNTAFRQNGERSFTYAYDHFLKTSLWVAYPLCAGNIGSGSRTDAWDYDPDLPESIQPVLYRGFKPGPGQTERYDRGHQIPSADRLDPSDNARTFTFTNAVPQIHSFNEGVWQKLEQHVRSWAKRSDTLYVVTGIIPGNIMLHDNEGRFVNVPSHFWKALLRRGVGKGGKVYWSATAFLCPHRAEEVPASYKEAEPYLQSREISVRELQNKLGYELFPNLRKEVGREEADYILQMEPSKKSWWWTGRFH